MKAEIRPRSTAEILDDAWRLYLSAAPLLLTLSSLFTVPFAVAMLLLLTIPRPDTLAARCVLPALTALALPLTGLASGACQQAFRHLAEGNIPSLKNSWKAALRHGVNHTAARAMLVLVALLAGMVLVVPGVFVWIISSAVHPMLATREASLFQAFRYAAQETQRQPLKSTIVFLARPLLFVFAFLNLHAFVSVLLWSAENLGGLDTAFLGVSLSLRNPIYDVCLALLAWMLLVPYSEAVNYLLHIDARARYEGLDLWDRVQRFFPVTPTSRTGMVILALLGALAWTGILQADDRLDALREARQELVSIRKGVESANPYPGGSHWQGQLRHLGQQLDPGGTADKGSYRWYWKAIDGFPSRKQNEALEILTQIDGRLALLEESLATPASAAGEGGPAPSADEIKKNLSRSPTDTGPVSGRKDTAKQKKETKKEPVKKDDPGEGNSSGGHRRGTGGVAPMTVTGLNVIGWLVLAGILVAIVVAGVVLIWKYWQKRPAPKKKAAEVEQPDLGLEAILSQPDRHTVSGLWKQADELARAGNWLEAIRTLYLAVLAMLHRSNLIRYERTRTNGEYVSQLHPHKLLQKTFARMTALFEVKWYGTRFCEGPDYSTCLEMAESIRDEVQKE